MKESLSSHEFCRLASLAIQKQDPSATVLAYPMADGGEGSLAALESTLPQKLRMVTTNTTNALGEPIEATYGIMDDTAIIEMAEASGLHLIPKPQRQIHKATSHGTGLLIKDAISRNLEKIILFVGGSATNDGGAGAIEALGGKFYKTDGTPITITGPKSLKEIAKLDTTGVHLDHIEVTIATDVTSPLLGASGASYVYAPQKGASPGELLELDECLAAFADRISAHGTSIDPKQPGMGAAGGLPFGISCLTPCSIKSGYSILAHLSGLEDALHHRDIQIVVTGEGSLDHQTANGKLVSRILESTSKRKVPTIAIAGILGKGYEDLYTHGLTAAFSLQNRPMDLETAISDSALLLEDVITNIARLVRDTASHKQ